MGSAREDGQGLEPGKREGRQAVLPDRGHGRRTLEAPFSTYPDEVRNFFAAMEANWRSWPDPAGLGPPVSDQMTPERVRSQKGAARSAAQGHFGPAGRGDGAPGEGFAFGGRSLATIFRSADMAHSTKTRRTRAAKVRGSLLSPESTGGITAGKGFDFQTRYTACHLQNGCWRGRFNSFFSRAPATSTSAIRKATTPFAFISK